MTITLSWSPVTLDDSGSPISIGTYNIYKDGAFLVSAAGSATSYDVAQDAGTTAVYRISAVSTLGIEGALSQEVTVSTPSGVPAAPANVTATQ